MQQTLQPAGAIRLRDVLPDSRFVGGTEIRATSCCSDSRQCRAGDVFVALTGARHDGHDFVDDAIRAGASAVVSERLLPVRVPVCIVEDTREAYGRICQSLVGNPSGSTQVAVTRRVRLGSELADPFGSYDTTGSDVNDGNNPRDHLFPDPNYGGTQVSVLGKSYLNGSVLHEVDSGSDSALVLTLRTGDIAPDIEGFNGQASVEDFLEPYIDPTTREVTIAAHQAIFLFELGTDDPDSSAADFQDLVVLLSLGRDPDEVAGSAAGRRIFLPWGADNYDPRGLSADALATLRRSLNWAARDRVQGYETLWDDQP